MPTLKPPTSVYRDRKRHKALKLVWREDEAPSWAKKSNHFSKRDGRWDALDSAWASGRGAKWTTVVIKKELKAPPVSTYCAPASETALAGMFSHNGRLKQLSITEPQKPPIPHPAPSFAYCSAQKVERFLGSSSGSSRPEALTEQGSDGWMDRYLPSVSIGGQEWGGFISAFRVKVFAFELVLLPEHKQKDPMRGICLFIYLFFLDYIF